MLFEIDDSDPRPIYRQIVDEVRRARLVGSVAPEEALPSVRQLSADLQVNPNTVQQAYRELEREGAVFVRRGQGTYVSPLGNDEADRERAALAAEVSRRALVDAHRHGLTTEELLGAIRREAAGSPASTVNSGGDP